ncbi:STAS domain-containing protein [Actinomycetes bacterium M1A6_2h]
MTDSHRSAHFDVSVEVEGSFTVVVVSGELDMSTTPAFSAAVSRALSSETKGVVVDFSAVEFLSSSAITVLLTAKDDADVSIVVVADSHVTRRPIELVGLDDVLAVHHTRKEALDSLSPA